MRVWVIALLISQACVGDKAQPADTSSSPPGVGDTSDSAASDDSATPAPDLDGDGYGADEDCDDNDASVHPGAEEVCDGVDNDCNNAVDDGLLVYWYQDVDGDGYGDESVSELRCDAAEGWVRQAGDCDDTDHAISPDAEEQCSGGVDEDCDGLVDCEDGACVSAEGCVEDCDTPGDEEGDGVEGCFDDECWGTAACPQPPRTTLLGGHYRRETYHGGGGAGTHDDLWLTGVTGRLSYWQASASTWNTCAWSFDEVWFDGMLTSAFIKGKLTRWGGRSQFTIEPGCGTSGDAFLPNTLMIGWMTCPGNMAVPTGSSTASGGWSLGCAWWYGGQETTRWTTPAGGGAGRSGVLSSAGPVVLEHRAPQSSNYWGR